MKRFIFLLLVPIHVTVLAQTETTEWWVDDEVYATTSCETGGDISVPTNPSKKGYTFQGWETAVYDMSTLDTSIKGSGFYINGNKWKVTFSYGAVYGEGLCSPTSNSEWYTNTHIDTTTGTGRYCWCRVTEFIPTGSEKIYESSLSNWAYVADTGSEENCAKNCVQSWSYCGRALTSEAGIRRKMYSSN